MRQHKQPEAVTAKINELMTLAITTSPELADIFVEYYAHIGRVGIMVYEGGWEGGTKPDMHFDIGLPSSTWEEATEWQFLKQMNEAINLIKEIL